MPRGIFLRCICVVSIGFSSLFILAQSQVSRVGAQGATVYEVTVTKDVMVAMRDGVHLATDIYRKL